MHWIANAFEKGEQCMAALSDLSRAFDCVEHDLLLQKLFYYGIRGVARSLMESYLTNRTQVVEYNDQRTSAFGINRGVAQGSLIGPLMFII